AGLLAQCGVARERVRIRPDAVVARDVLADRDHGPPLREARAELAILVHALTQAVEALGDLLLGRVGQWMRALVDLDSGDDPLVGKQLGERRAVRSLLADRLVVEDDAADVVGGAL